MDIHLQSLDVSFLQTHRQILLDELDPKKFVDVLLKERAIELFEHDKITNEISRRRMVSKLLEIVSENKNNCFPIFLYILQMNQGYILKEIFEPVQVTEQPGMFYLSACIFLNVKLNADFYF